MASDPDRWMRDRDTGCSSLRRLRLTTGCLTVCHLESPKLLQVGAEVTPRKESPKLHWTRALSPAELTAVTL